MAFCLSVASASLVRVDTSSASATLDGPSRRPSSSAWRPLKLCSVSIFSTKSESADFTVSRPLKSMSLISGKYLSSFSRSFPSTFSMACASSESSPRPIKPAFPFRVCMERKMRFISSTSSGVFSSVTRSLPTASSSSSDSSTNSPYSSFTSKSSDISKPVSPGMLRFPLSYRLLDRAQELGRLKGLCEKIRSPKLHRFLSVTLALLACEHHNRDIGVRGVRLNLL